VIPLYTVLMRCSDVIECDVIGWVYFLCVYFIILSLFHRFYYVTLISTVLLYCRYERIPNAAMHHLKNALTGRNMVGIG